MFRRTTPSVPQLPASQLAVMSQIAVPAAGIKQQDNYAPNGCNPAISMPVPDPAKPSRFKSALDFIVSHRYEIAYGMFAGVVGYFAAPRHTCYLM